MSEPTITVTNLGDQGTEAVFGVIYPPQVALVGFGRIIDRPWDRRRRNEGGAMRLPHRVRRSGSAPPPRSAAVVRRAGLAPERLCR